MAKILYGGGVANMSGSQAGTVHSHNQFGSYTRNRVVPVNPRTEKQTSARSRLAYCAARWRLLTDSQRLDWAALGAQIVRTDPLGQTYTLKGFNAFCLINAHKLASLEPLIIEAPALDDPPVPTITSISVSAEPDFTIAYTQVGGLATNKFEIWASAPVSAGKSFVPSGALKKITSVLGNATSPPDFTAAYEAVFGNVLTTGIGERVFVEFRPFSAAGLPGPAVRSSAIIADAP